MQNRSIERMVLLGFSMSLTLVLAVSSIAWYSSNSSREAGVWVTHTHQVLAGLQHIASGLHRAESSQRGYFVTGMASPYLAERRIALKGMEEQLDHVAKLTRDSFSQQKQITALREAIEARLLTLERGLQQYGSSTNTGTMEFLDNFALGTRQMGEITRLLDLMREEELHLLGMREKEAEDKHAKENLAFGVLVPLVICLLVFCSIASATTWPDARLRSASSSASSPCWMQPRIWSRWRMPACGCVISTRPGAACSTWVTAPILRT